MKKHLFANILTILLLSSATPCLAQRVEYDFYQDGYRFLNTATTTVLTPEGSFYPISISLDYYGNDKGEQYLLRLYGRYELSQETRLAIILEDGTKMQLEAFASNIYHSRLGLIRMKTIYDALYLVNNEQLSSILNTPITCIKIKTGDEWMSQIFKYNPIGKWLTLNYIAINKKLNKTTN